jgi:hypothetical protein
MGPCGECNSEEGRMRRPRLPYRGARTAPLSTHSEAPGSRLGWLQLPSHSACPPLSLLSRAADRLLTAPGRLSLPLPDEAAAAERGLFLDRHAVTCEEDRPEVLTVVCGVDDSSGVPVRA